MGIKERIVYFTIALLLISTSALATVFPGAIDSFLVSVTGTPVSSADINNVKTAVEALEAKVGVDGSAVVTSFDWLLKNASSSDPGHVHTGASIGSLDGADITTGTVALARGGTGASLVIGAAGTFLQSNGAAVVFGTDGSSLNFLNASNITSGTLGDARLSSNVALLNAIQTFTAANTFTAAGTAVDITNNLLVGGNITAPTIFGGTGVSSALNLRGTSNGTPSGAHIVLNGSGEGFVGIGVVPDVMLDLDGDTIEHNRTNATFGPVWIALRSATEVGRIAWDNAGTFDVRTGASATLGLSISNTNQAVNIPGTGGINISGDGSSPVPASLFNVGPANEFRVDSNGDLIRINDVPYTWPAAQGGATTVLTNNGSGTLTWGTPAGLNIAWNSLIAPTGNLSISHSSFTTVFTWGSTTSTNNLFTLEDSANNTGTGYLFTVDTNTSSTLNPFRVLADTLQALSVDSTGLITMLGTVDNAVLRLSSIATNDDPTIDTIQHRAATTDATVTTLATITTSADKTYQIHVRVLARRTGGTGGTADDGAAYECAATYTTKTSTLTEMAETCWYEHEDQAGWDVDFAPSGSNILVRVTGAVNNNITWHGTVETSSVGS